MQQGNESPYFSNTAAYVLTRPGEDGKLLVAGDGTQEGPAVACHLSPVHALIEAGHWMLRGQQFGITHAGLIDRKVFRTADGSGLIADMRLAWPVLGGRIVLRPDGGLATFSRVMVHRTFTSGPPSFFEVDELALEQIGSLHERAGLFAWRETNRDVLTWDAGRLARMAMRAVGTMETTEGDVSQCQEAALFDPEFGQWHFVPLDGLLA
jgi:hypothetical protein